MDRDIIMDDAAGCLTGCSGTETAYHLFITCDFYGSLGIRCGLGLVSQDQTLLMSQNIFISLLIQQVACEQGAPFCSLFDCFVRGSYGMTLIKDCLII